MDLRDLKMFLHLAESRHFGRSARAMHVSPSTLSRQIQRLEEDLGQPLFVRDNRTVTLTEAGEELRVFAQQTLLQYQQLRQQFLSTLTLPVLNQELKQQLSREPALLVAQPKGEPEVNAGELRAIYDKIMAPAEASPAVEAAPTAAVQ